MPVCVECGSDVPSLYIEYGKGNIKLSQCERCNDFADKYLEYDVIIIFIDMLLHKPPVYRHLLHNRLSYDSRGINNTLVKIGILFLLFEVYLKWFRLDQLRIPIYPQDASVLVQYIITLTLCISEFLVSQFTIRFLSWILSRFTLTREALNRLSMALILSSFGKILLIVMVIWDYGNLDPTFLVSLLVFTSNLEALAVFLRTGGIIAGLILGSSLGAKWILHRFILYLDPGFETLLI